MGKVCLPIRAPLNRDQMFGKPVLLEIPHSRAEPHLNFSFGGCHGVYLIDGFVRQLDSTGSSERCL